MILWVRNAGKGPQGNSFVSLENSLVWSCPRPATLVPEIWGSAGKVNHIPTHGLSSMEILLVSLHTCGLGLQKKVLPQTKRSCGAFQTLSLTSAMHQRSK